MIDVIRGCAAFVFAFSFAIFIHELGHFMFAKLFGVYVETFSIGFGKKIFKRKWGETEYAISVLPFGGYVKMRGMHSKELEAIIHAEEEQREKTEDIAESVASDVKESLSDSVIEEIDALREKPYWQKFLIFSAGCINNFLTGVVVLSLLFFFGFHREPPLKAVFNVADYVPKGLVPLKHGDQIIAVAGQHVDSMRSFEKKFDKFARKYGFTEVPVTILREGTTQTVQLPYQVDPDFPGDHDLIVKVGAQKTKDNKTAAAVAFGFLDKASTISVTFTRDGKTSDTVVPPIVAMGTDWILGSIRPVIPPYISYVIRNLPAEKAGIQIGDVIVSINGEAVDTEAGARKILRSLLNKPADIVVKRGNETKKIKVDVRPDPENPAKGQIGISFGLPLTDWYQLPLVPAFKRGFKEAGSMATRYVAGLSALFKSSFQTIRENVGGPIQIAGMLYSTANRDWVWFFNFFAALNIILAITNLLPLPVLDGGHILFSTIEFIIRRPLPARWLVVIYNVFIFIIIGLAVMVSLNDVIMNVWRLF